MIQVFRTLSKDLVIALSGGVDSMFAFHWLKNKGHNVKIAHYVHKSENANAEFEFVKSIAIQYETELIVEYQKEEREITPTRNTNDERPCDAGIVPNGT